MHDRAAFKEARALVARIPAHTAPALHSRAPYGCPTTAASLSGPSWARPCALQSCSGPFQAGATDQARSLASQGLSHRRQAHCLGPMGLGWVISDENPTEPANSFGILSLACFFSGGSAHIRLYLSISVHICLHLNLSWPDHTHFVT